MIKMELMYIHMSTKNPRGDRLRSGPPPYEQSLKLATDSGERFMGIKYIPFQVRHGHWGLFAPAWF
ncbi:hypothetical protein FOXYSP1_06790 [Fusarium oxysporum f. sp. phaseoli]